MAFGVLCDSWFFLVVFVGFWWFLVFLVSSQWFLVVFGDSNRFLLVFWFFVVLANIVGSLW